MIDYRRSSSPLDTYRKSRPVLIRDSRAKKWPLTRRSGIFA
jgi:hypothetical protein